MDLTKNKNRANRRKRNMLAKEMRETKVFHEKKIPPKAPKLPKLNPRFIDEDEDEDLDVPFCTICGCYHWAGEVCGP